MTSGANPLLRPLWRPVGPEELALIEASGWRRFPPRLPEQPIFYPVCNEAYATQIARDWNVKASGAGFVLAFDVEEAWAARYPIRRVGGEIHDELWVPAEELEPGPFTRDEPRQGLNDAHGPVGADGCDPGAARRRRQRVLAPRRGASATWRTRSCPPVACDTPGSQPRSPPRPLVHGPG